MVRIRQWKKQEKTESKGLKLTRPSLLQPIEPRRYPESDLYDDLDIEGVTPTDIAGLSDEARDVIEMLIEKLAEKQDELDTLEYELDEMRARFE